MESKYKYLETIKAISALDNAKDTNNSRINFIVVSPECQGKGVATRMIRSITDNTPFFSGYTTNNVIDSQIHFSNKASRIAFERSGFGKISTEKHDDQFDRYYFVKEN